MGGEILLSTEFKDLKFFKRGKVRDVYDLGDKLLIISTDRISAFDVVFPCGIPYKGKVLTALSLFWFNFTRSIVKNHLLSSDVSEYPEETQKYRQELLGRSMLVLKTRPLPIECVVRGYLSGSGWKEYKEKQSICGISLPKGLSESAKLPEILFTPTTKEDVGHDINVTDDYVRKTIGNKLALRIKEISIAVYRKAHDYAVSKGIIIADTKFEFGIHNGEVILIDEVLTPDSSRFWPSDLYRSGQPQPSFDKQYVRDYLESLDWDKTLPAPMLPEEIINKTCAKYLQAYKRLTGSELKN